jgi:phosphoglycolate phosphatase-like HAD superfamily hydrolase
MHTLLLFDIDGTLMWGGRAAKEAFTFALTEVYGTTGRIEEHDFSGKTDLQITRELLTGAGVDDPTIDEGFHGFQEIYLEGLRQKIVDHPPYALEGATELVDLLARQQDVALGLVTGNIMPAAFIKLAAIGLEDHFEVGGYGCDHEARDLLPGVAMSRARDRWGVDFPADSVWVLGDTPRDVACGKHHGLRTLAVATGHYDSDRLRATGADIVVENFSDPGRVAEVILKGS